MPIRTLIFDLGKVIVDFDFDVAYRRMGALCGLEREEMRSRLRVANLVADYETGVLDSDAFVREVNQRLGLRLGVAEFGEIWSSIFHRTPLIAESLLAALRRDYRLVLLSNTNPLHFDMIRGNYPHIAHFDGLVLSHKVGAMKPEAAIYRAAIEHAQCAPNQCLFFDDIEENVRAARAMGLNAERFNGIDGLRRDLAAYGIETP